MSSAIGLSSPTRNQASIPLSQSFQGVQDFSKFDAAELSGYVEAEGASSYRTSVKLSIVKNGAGVYEVAASDIAGDDVSGSPLVSFQMTGSLLEAKIDSGVASFSSAVIKFALISPPNSSGSLSLDAASVVSGTIDSARLPGSVSPIGAISAYNPGYFTDASNGSFTLVGPAGNTVSDVNAYLPSNWRVCDGSELNDSESPIFNGAGRYLPNLSNGRFLMGSTAAGAIGGASSVTLTEDNMPPHTHAIDHNHASVTSASTAPSLRYRTPAGFIASANDNRFMVLATNTPTGTATPNGISHTHTVDLPNFSGTSGSTGNGTAFSILPTYLSTYYILRVK